MSGRLLFDDEFDTFDAYSKSDAWRTAYTWGASTVINGEKGYYVDTEHAGTTGPAGAVNPFSVSNGVLTITSAPATGLPSGQPYTSGVISSMGSFERQYGYYEMRADMPGGQGFWPAFWLMPVDKVSPPELDIMEFSSKRANEYVTTAHSNAGGTYQMSQQFSYGLPDLSSGFHTYAVDWQADKVTWYFDDRAVYSIATPDDFHKPMYMLVNQAVGGGSWIGAPDGSTQQFNVDYVRVYDSKPSDAAAPPSVPTAPPPTTAPTSTSTPTTVPQPSAASLVFGDSAANLIPGNAAAQTVAGGDGDDTVMGGDGGDVVCGNQGNDLLLGNAGADTLYGGRGDDVVYGGGDDDRLFGDDGLDRLAGDGGNDTLAGAADSDTLTGGDGSDLLLGNQGADLLLGNAGADTLYGGRDNDTLFGGLDDDLLSGDDGDDVLTGNAGNDTFVFAPGSGHDTITDFAAGDRIAIAAGMSYTLGSNGAGDAVISFSGSDD
ncbi:family 16 glycosylhydrolase, partial [Azospirillum sp. sgz301742]